MGGLFFHTLWARYLGWQWRRARTVQNEINELKKQVKPTPVTPEGKPVEAATSLRNSRFSSSLKRRRNAERVLHRDRDFNAGSISLGFGVLEAVAGGVNTWFRT